MINHIVMWKLSSTDSQEKQTIGNTIKEKLEKLPDSISEIIELHVGINIENPAANFDVILSSKFANMDDLDTYQKHPDHQAVAGYVKTVVTERACVDYEV